MIAMLILLDLFNVSSKKEQHYPKFALSSSTFNPLEQCKIIRAIVQNY